MKIVIFGATGKTGTLLVEQALNKGYEVVAYIRKRGPVFNGHPNLKIVVGRLNETLRMKDAITGADACISALGSGSLTHRSPDIVHGIGNIVSIMESAGVRRFIYMSSIGAGDSRLLIAQPSRFFVVNILLRVPIADHNANEKRISSSNLNWTIIRPGVLTDGAITGSLKSGTDISPLKKSRSISRANVASFILDQLSDETYLKKAAWLYE
ncbi:MAG: SDR family oxidoreductase [Paludibacter sp.]